MERLERRRHLRADSSRTTGLAIASAHLAVQLDNLTRDGLIIARLGAVDEFATSADHECHIAPYRYRLEHPGRAVLRPRGAPGQNSTRITCHGSRNCLEWFDLAFGSFSAFRAAQPPRLAVAIIQG